MTKTPLPLLNPHDLVPIETKVTVSVIDWVELSLLREWLELLNGGCFKRHLVTVTNLCECKCVSECVSVERWGVPLNRSTGWGWSVCVVLSPSSI